MVDKRSWDDFRASGLLWWINMILHTFGWAICVELDDCGKVSTAYPARVKYRGFSPEHNDAGYRKVSKFILDSANKLYEETNEQI